MCKRLTWKFSEEKITNLPEQAQTRQKARSAELGRDSALISVVQRLVVERLSFLFPVSSLPSDEGIDAKVLKGRFKVHV